MKELILILMVVVLSVASFIGGMQVDEAISKSDGDNVVPDANENNDGDNIYSSDTSGSSNEGGYDSTPMSSHSGLIVTQDPNINRDTIKIKGADGLSTLNGGDSMYPVMKKDYTYITREYTGQDLEKGDIIKFKAPEGIDRFDTWVHRIRELNGDEIVTKGDNNQHSETIDREDVESVVVGVIYTD